MEYHLAIEPSCSFQYFLINEPVCRPESDDTKKQQPFKNIRNLKEKGIQVIKLMSNILKMVHLLFSRFMLNYGVI